MSFRIQNNIASCNHSINVCKNENELNNSLSRLSRGLNKNESELNNSLSLQSRGLKECKGLTSGREELTVSISEEARAMAASGKNSNGIGEVQS